MEHWIGLAIQVLIGAVTVIAAYFALRFEVRIVRHDVGGLKTTILHLLEEDKLLHRKVESLGDHLRAEFGEIAVSLRTAYFETRGELKTAELYVRDNFTRKETFGTVVAKMESDLSALGERIENRLTRMETKIDTLQRGGSSG